jgi:hypothetical protein
VTSGLASALVLGLVPELAAELEPALVSVLLVPELVPIVLLVPVGTAELLSGFMPASLGLSDLAEDAEPDED